MHELAITRSILEIALKHAATARAGRITALHLVVGQMASIVDDSVQFYWDIVSEGTAAEGARLYFRRVPVEFSCTLCTERYQPNSAELACPVCGGIDVKLTKGDEFFLEAIDIE